MSESALSAQVNAGAILVLGIGNAMKGDDGIGPYVAARLDATCRGPARHPDVQPAPRVTALDCGTTPENYTSVVRRMRPELLILVDAAHMGLEPGDYRIIPAERAGALGLSTHSMPLSMFMSYVSDLACRIILIGVQPATMVLGQGLCGQVAASADRLVEILARGEIDCVAQL